MKAKTHPKYHDDAKVTCACGNAWKTGSTIPEIKVEICSACHPFYTGKQKLVDTARRVDRYKQLVAKQEEQLQSTLKRKEAAKKKASGAKKPAKSEK